MDKGSEVEGVLMEASYKGKVVVVTGAGSGIGRMVARTYARAAAHVILLDYNAEVLQQTFQEMIDDGYAATTYTVNLKAPEEIDEVFQEIQRRFTSIDVLINNAGVSKFKSLFDLSVDDWDDVLNTNLRGTFLCSQAAARLMKQHRGGGSIVNIASTRAMMSEPSSEAYAASKGGILSLTHALAVSLGEYSITVNAISPGWIETGDYERLSAADHEQHPSRRVGKTEDIARACLYLTDSRNDFITGINLVIDGGMTRKMIYAE